MSDKNRVMWLLNHTSARKFEIPMLKACGVDEIFLPKSFPTDPSFRSASIDWSEDENLTIPQEDLDILNACDWYTGATPEAWRIANKWFDKVFFIAVHPQIVLNITKYYRGIAILRVYGVSSDLNYGIILNHITEGNAAHYLRRLGNRFIFGMAYDHLANEEPDFLKKRALYLPLGMPNALVEDKWTGENENILFVCPDIGFNPYYNNIYKKFKSDFSGFDYLISGAQPIRVMDKNVLGFVDYDTHNNNMTKSRVMFYHSQEPNHIHYHPFEAIKNGMPLIFMANGLLDKLGGINQPGRCKTINEARKKIKRLMEGDQKLIQQIKQSQVKLLEAMNFKLLEPHWINGLNLIDSIINKYRIRNSLNLATKELSHEKKIAIILPVGYLGGSLRGAILIANSLLEQSVKNGDHCKIIFYHIEDKIYKNDMFEELDARITLRPFKWKTLNHLEAIRSMEYAGYEGWEIKNDAYLVPDDGLNFGFDCDLWFIISDRLKKPLLPVKPTVMMVYDYLQRRNNYINQKLKQSSENLNETYISNARFADKVLVTSQFTYNDAIQYAGIKKERLTKVPMLIPDFVNNNSYSELDEIPQVLENKKSEPYFIWPTNSSQHKNCDKIFRALKIYYDIYAGQLNCLITGVDTDKLLTLNFEHTKDAKKTYSESKNMKRKVKLQGNLSDHEYKLILKESSFLLHSSHGDNGTFSVIKAALFNIPALSNKYPAIEEMDKNYKLNLTYFDVFDVHNTAKKLKWMEIHCSQAKAALPSPQEFRSKIYNHSGEMYWEAVRDLL